MPHTQRGHKSTSSLIGCIIMAQAHCSLSFEPTVTSLTSETTSSKAIFDTAWIGAVFRGCNRWRHRPVTTAKSVAAEP
ncbi:hypothetical protein BDW67DRAFT_164214 [Aspergillus spinulosporus]